MEGMPVLEKVKKQKPDSMGFPVGEANPNLIFDTRVYWLEFPDGAMAEYSVNVINEIFKIRQSKEDGTQVYFPRS